MTRRILKASRYTQRQDLFAEFYGELTNEGEDWSNDQIDELLDGFLVDELRYLSARSCLRKITGRSQEAVSSMIWKLATNYDRVSIRDYKPGHFRQKRTGPFTLRDKAIIEAATGQHGQKTGGHQVDRLAMILGRTPDEIAEFYAVACNKARQERQKHGAKPESIATSVNRTVRGSHERLLKEIGL